MPRASIITISGTPGSGKSSTAKKVASALAYRHFSSGDLMRQIGQKHGLSIEETNRAAEKDPSFDEEVDETLRNMRSEERVVIDSRTAFHWIPQSFKVFLKIDPHTAALRTFAQIQTEGRLAQDAHSSEDVYQKNLSRIESERKRYESAYNFDYLDESQYDLVIDTTRHPLDEVARSIVEKYSHWLAGGTT